jgi:hypothetical protein
VNGCAEADAGSLDIRAEEPLQDLAGEQLPLLGGDYLVEPVAEEQRLGDVQLDGEEDLFGKKR